MPEENEKRFLTIHNDIVFKNLFGVDKNIKNTTSMLEEFFGFEKGYLNGSEITNSVVLDKETILTKKFELDIKLKDPYGNIYNLEMQRVLDKEAETKNLIYLTGIFFGSLTPGKNYSKMNKAIQLEFVKKDKRHKNNEIIRKYALCNVEDVEDRILEDLFGMYIIDVDQERFSEYNKDSKFESWRRFIGAETKEELESIAKGDKILETALKESLRFMNEDYVQDFSREELLYESRLDTAREEGLIQGKLEGKLEMALKC